MRHPYAGTAVRQNVFQRDKPADGRSSGVETKTYRAAATDIALKYCHIIVLLN